MHDLEISPPHENEDEALDRVLSTALHFPGSIGDWLARIGRENFRAVRRQGRIVAGVALAPMGQWFGGTRVPMVGINGVGVAPDQRGSGVGTAMMAAILEELHAAGTPLSVLYPATLRFYQRNGYERAGYRYTYELPLDAIDARDQGLTLEPVEPPHYEALYQLYEQRARRSAGNLDRPAWMWRLRLEPKDRQPFRFIVRRNGEAEGYVVYVQANRSEPVTVLDHCVLTPAAGRQILALFAGYRSMVEHLVWSSGPNDPLLYLLGENLSGGERGRARIVRPFEWMLRIADVPAALQARGYPPEIRADVHFDVRDDLLAANNRRWVLQISGGKGEAQEGGTGRVRLGIRELAALYTGFMAPAELRAIGAIEATDEDLALIGAIFAGPRPWIADMF